MNVTTTIVSLVLILIGVAGILAQRSKDRAVQVIGWFAILIAAILLLVIAIKVVFLSDSTSLGYTQLVSYPHKEPIAPNANWAVVGIGAVVMLLGCAFGIMGHDKEILAGIGLVVIGGGVVVWGLLGFPHPQPGYTGEVQASAPFGSDKTMAMQIAYPTQGPYPPAEPLKIPPRILWLIGSGCAALLGLYWIIKSRIAPDPVGVQAGINWENNVGIPFLIGGIVFFVIKLFQVG